MKSLTNNDVLTKLYEERARELAQGLSQDGSITRRVREACANKSCVQTAQRPSSI